MIEKKSLQDKKKAESAHPDRALKINDDGSKRSSAVLFAFLFTGLLLTSLYAILGFYPFGTHSVIISDLGVQYAPDLVAYKNLLLSGGIHTYSFLIGMGKNVFGFFAYYLASPINFVTFLFPDAMISEAILVLITIKLSLAAAFMTLFLRRRFHSESGFAIVFGIVYASCSYVMAFMTNIMWLDGFYLLPLLLFFVEQFLDNRRYWWRVVLTLFVLFVSGFYIAYIVGVFSFLFLLLRLFEKKTPGTKTSGKTAGLFVGGAVLAAGMSAALLIPAGIDILGNADQTAKIISLDTSFTFLSLLNQLLAGSFDSLSHNKPLVYCGLAVLFLCVLFFMNPSISRRRKGLAGGVIIFFVFCFNFSFLDLAWQLFDSPNWFQHRYSFLFVFVLLEIAFASILHIRNLKPKAFVITGIMFLILLFAVQSFGDLANEGDRFYINLFIGLLELLCLYAMTGVAFPESIANLKKLVPALLVILICLEVVYVNPLFMRPKIYGSETKREDHVSAVSQAESLVEAAKEDVLTDHIAFYRMDTDIQQLDGLHPMSAGLYLNYPSISTFNTSANKDLNRLLKQLGYDTNYNYFTSGHSYSSVVADSLLGVRYVLSADENPGGYELLASSSNNKIFLQKNKLAMPLLYLVDAGASDFDFFALEKNPADKNLFVFQDELLVSLFGKDAFSANIFRAASVPEPVLYNAVIKENVPKTVSDFGTASGGVTSDSPDIDSDTQSAVKDTDLLGEEPVGKKEEYGITYLRMSANDVLSLTYSVEIASTDPLFLSLPAVAQNDQADVYVNDVLLSKISSSSYSQILSLGSFTPGETVTVKVRSDSNSYSILSALFYYCDTALFEKEITAAVQNQDVQITQVEDGYVAAQISVPQDQLLLTTIPYEKGWTLRVDGVVIPIEAYQAALISVPVTAGSHTITLSFTPPGMWAGIAVSSAAGLVFLGAIIYTYRKRSKPL